MGRPWTISPRLITALVVSSFLFFASADELPAQSKGDKAEKSDKAKKKELSSAEKKRLEESRRRRAAARERRVRERILGARHLEEALSPWVPNITDCYKKHGLTSKRATGVVRLEVLVQPNGRLRRMHVIAPGVRGKKLAKCIQAIGDKLRFPERKGFTKATVPFRFLQRKAAGAGPIQSCWSKRGCSSRRPSARKKKADKSKKAVKADKKNDNKKADKSKKKEGAKK